MKTIFTLIALLLITKAVSSQDLIVTSDGDSINCKITKVKKENIYFTFKHKDEIRSTLLPIEKVSNHQINFFQESDVPKDKVIGHPNYQQFRFAINGGFGYQAAKIGDGVPSDFKDYVRKLKSGFVVGADLTYYFSEVFGLGVKYARFNSSNNLDNIYIEDDQGVRQYGRMSDKLTIGFFGPTISTRFLNSTKSRALILVLGMGYMRYNDDKLIVNNYKMTGNTFGMSYDIAYEFELTKKTSLGFQLSLISGYLSSYKWDDGSTIQTVKLGKDENDPNESLYRIDLTIGLRFGK